MGSMEFQNIWRIILDKAHLKEEVMLQRYWKYSSNACFNWSPTLHQLTKRKNKNSAKNVSESIFFRQTSIDLTNHILPFSVQVSMIAQAALQDITAIAITWFNVWHAPAVCTIHQLHNSAIAILAQRDLKNKQTTIS